MSRRQKPAIDSSIPPADLPLRPSVRFRLAKNDTFFGPGVAEFLILVDQSNSMQTACKEMEMSYSKSWKIIKKAENYLGYSLIESKSGGASGGSSHLTPEAKELLTRYQSMEKELKAATAQLFEKYFGVGGTAIFTEPKPKTTTYTYDTDRQDNLSMVAESITPYGKKN